jgi:hypothetical protein
MIATVRMIGFQWSHRDQPGSVPLIGKALRDKLGTMHGPFVGITMMGPGVVPVAELRWHQEHRQSPRSRASA